MSKIGLPKGMTADEAYIQGVWDGEKRMLKEIRRFAKSPEGFGRPTDRLWDRLIDYLDELKSQL